MPPVGTATRPRKAKNRPPAPPRPEREVVHPEIDMQLFLAEDGKFITADYAKELLGWRTTTEKGEAQFVDMEDTYIVCDYNLGNREFDMKVALGKAYDILNRQWADSRNSLPDDDEPMSINGQATAVINRYGEVEDGQKTLAGLVFAKQIWEGLGKIGKEQRSHWQGLWPTEPTIEGYITFGISASSRVKRTIDYTQTRNFQDVLFTSGYFGDQSRADRSRLTRILSYAVRYLWSRVWGNIDSFNPCHTNSTLFTMIDRHGGKVGHLVQAVRHIATEDSIPKNQAGKPIPNARRKLSRYVPPGTAAGMLYLMGSAKSDGEVYRHADPPNELVLDWEMWDRALEFWVALGKIGSADFASVRDAFSALVDPETGEMGGTSAERQAILIKAWHRWAEHHKIRDEDAALSDDMYQIHRDSDGKLLSKSLVIHPKIGGIDSGEPEEREPGETQEPGPEELKSALGPSGGIATNGDDPDEEKRIREELESKSERGSAGDVGEQPPANEPPSLADQLKDLKDRHPDKLLIFKRAKSYAAWGEDAKVLKAILKADLRMVSGVACAEFKSKNLAGNLLKLIQAGHRVALCEQVEEVTVVKDYEGSIGNGKSPEKSKK